MTWFGYIDSCKTGVRHDLSNSMRHFKFVNEICNMLLRIIRINKFLKYHLYCVEPPYLHNFSHSLLFILSKKIWNVFFVKKNIFVIFKNFVENTETRKIGKDDDFLISFIRFTAYQVTWFKSTHTHVTLSSSTSLPSSKSLFNDSEFSFSEHNRYESYDFKHQSDERSAPKTLVWIIFFFSFKTR